MAKTYTPAEIITLCEARIELIRDYDDRDYLVMLRRRSALYDMIAVAEETERLTGESTAFPIMQYRRVTRALREVGTIHYGFTDEV